MTSEQVKEIRKMHGIVTVKHARKMLFKRAW
jgi:hypothetical protein